METMKEWDRERTRQKILARQAWRTAGGDALLGPLAWSVPEGVAKRHERFDQERWLLCWDPASETVVEVADYARDEYWGERVLEVAQRLSKGLRGLRWQRRESELVELGEPFQGLAAKAVLGELSSEESEELASMLGQAWSARIQARALGEAAKEGGLGAKSSRL